ncbi:MAG: putative toxin-antitoxin system toxin component, PIN family [Bryobacteraceae bacterium]
MANSKRVRVVLDTNVLISAALKPAGLEAAVVNAVLENALEAWVTDQVWTEYEEVLARPKFAAVRAESRRILEALDKRVRRTVAVTASTVAVDEDDNRFLECAEAAQAHFLVTGNLRHYPAESGPTRMVNARGLFDAGIPVTNSIPPDS